MLPVRCRRLLPVHNCILFSCGYLRTAIPARFVAVHPFPSSKKIFIYLRLHVDLYPTLNTTSIQDEDFHVPPSHYGSWFNYGGPGQSIR